MFLTHSSKGDVMSAKSTKSTKKLSVPRALPEIQGEYQQACANLGQVDYQLFIYNREKDKLRTRIEALNNEAAARNQLDKDTKVKEESEVAAQTTSTGGNYETAEQLLQSQAV